MGYLDYSDAWMRALTRERRRERAARKAGHVVRYSPDGDTARIISYEFKKGVALPGGGRSGSKRQSVWRRNELAKGNRWCAYCGCEVSDDLPEGHPHRATTDHRHPKALGGWDVGANYAMACFTCNNRKGRMTEAEFRALLACDPPRLTA